MKTKLTLLVAVLVSFNAPAADDLTAVLQQGLFNEEADHDLAAAIKAYQFVVTGADAQRKLAATAVFRLGECYRKLGQTNDAITQYQRILEQFTDQTNLVTLSRQNLVGLGAAKTSAARPNDTDIGTTPGSLLEAILAAKQVDAAQMSALVQKMQALNRSELRRVLPTVAPDPLLNRLLEELASAESKTAELSGSLAPGHPNIKALRDKIAVLNTQIDERTAVALQGLKVKAEAFRLQVEDLKRELENWPASRTSPGGRAAPTPAQAEAHRLLIERLELEIKTAETEVAGYKELVRQKHVPANSADKLQARLLDLRRQLILARDAGPTGTADGTAIADVPLPNFSPTARAQLKELLQGEISVASQLLAEQRKKVQIGAIPSADVWRFERDVLGLNRQLLAVDGLASAEDRKRWREMLVEEIVLAEKAVQNERAKLDAGKSIASELAKLQRDVFALKRELVTFDAALALASPAAAPREVAATDEEEKEIRRIRALIEDSPDLINAVVNNSTLLLQASWKGQLIVARFLLENGAKVDQQAPVDWGTPLIAAASQGHKRMVELLLSKGANPNAKNPSGRAALHEAAEKGFLGVAEVLIGNRAEVDVRDGTGETPLHDAINAGQRDMAEVLLQHGANINARRDNGDTPLHMAAMGGDAESIALLLDHKADINAKNRSEAPPLWAALDPRWLEAARLLLEKGASSDFVVGGDSPAHVAVRRNSVELLQLLLAHKAKPDVRHRSGLTPLQFIVIDERAFSRLSPELIPALIKAGADPDAPLPESATVNYRNARTSGKFNVPRFPMLLAALLRQDLSIVEALLANGADVNATAPEPYGGATALMYAIDAESQEFVDAVLRHKPDLEARTKVERRTGLHYAVKSGDLKATEALLRAGAKVDAADGKGWTPLHFAVEKWNSELVRALLQAGANPNIFAVDGWLPLSLARRTSASSLPSEEVRREFSQLLLRHGADESLPRSRGITVTRRSRGFEQVLFTKGTNDFNGHTLYELMARFYAPGLPRSQERAFPDLRQIAIERSQVGAAPRQILVDLEARVASEPCTNDFLLEWGDLVEIRETEHPLQANWVGLDGMLATNISQCLGRAVELVIKGRTNRIELRASAVFADQTFGSKNGHSISQDSFRLAEVLHRSGLLLTTSDLSRVRVRRRDSVTGRLQEWVLDETKPNLEIDLWLRDGDVIEVPEKDPNAPPSATTGSAAPAPDGSGFRTLPARALRSPTEAK